MNVYSFIFVFSILIAAYIANSIGASFMVTATALSWTVAILAVAAFANYLLGGELLHLFSTIAVAAAWPLWRPVLNSMANGGANEAEMANLFMPNQVWFNSPAFFWIVQILLVCLIVHATLSTINNRRY